MSAVDVDSPRSIFRIYPIGKKTVNAHEPYGTQYALLIIICKNQLTVKNMSANAPQSNQYFVRISKGIELANSKHTWCVADAWCSMQKNRWQTWVLMRREESARVALHFMAMCLIGSWTFASIRISSNNSTICTWHCCLMDFFFSLTK